MMGLRVSRYNLIIDGKRGGGLKENREPESGRSPWSR